MDRLLCTQQCITCGETPLEDKSLCSSCDAKAGKVPAQKKKLRKTILYIMTAFLVVGALLGSEWWRLNTMPARFEAIGSYYDGMVLVRHNGRVGVVDLTREEVVIRFGRYHGLEFFPDGMLRVERGNRVGLVDLASGDEVIPLGRYQQIQPYYGGVAAVVLDGSWGVIDIKSGEEFIPFGKFDEIQSVYVCDGIAIVGIYNYQHVITWGIIDIESGKEMIPFGEFDAFLGSIYNGMIAVSSNGQYGGLLEIESRRMVIPFGKYERIVSIESGIAKVEDRGEMRRLVDLTSGEEIIFRDYRVNGLRLLPNGMVAVMRDDMGRREVAIIDLATEEAVFPFGRYSFFHYADGLIVVAGGLTFYSLRGSGRNLLGVMEVASGEIVVPLTRNYHDIRLYPDGFIAFQQDGLWWFDRIEAVRLTYAELISAAP